MATDYGTDVSTLPDLDETFAPLTGPAVVAQHIARSLADHRRGVDLRRWLNDSFDAARTYQLQQTIEAQCLADERVLSAEVSVTQPTLHDLQIIIALRLFQGRPFRLVLAVTAVSVELLSFEAA